MKKSEFIDTITGKRSYLDYTPDEVYSLASKLGDVVDFCEKSKTTINPLNKTEIDGLFLYLVDFATKPITELSHQEKLVIIRDHFTELEEVDVISDSMKNRASIDEKKESSELKYSKKILQAAVFKHITGKDLPPRKKA